jgi:hypothetical protein
LYHYATRDLTQHRTSGTKTARASKCLHFLRSSCEVFEDVALCFPKIDIERVEMFAASFCIAGETSFSTISSGQPCLNVIFSGFPTYIPKYIPKQWFGEKSRWNTEWMLPIVWFADGLEWKTRWNGYSWVLPPHKVGSEN